jgi:hypothetical protein
MWNYLFKKYISSNVICASDVHLNTKLLKNKIKITFLIMFIRVENVNYFMLVCLKHCIKPFKNLHSKI